MPDAVALVKLIKKMAIEAVEASKPVHLCYGIVESISPLKINVEQKMILGSAQLILLRNVTDYKIKLAVDTDGQDVREITIRNGLSVGEKVVLARQQGGQKYIVLDRSVL